MTDVDDWTQGIHQGDAIEVLEQMPESSVHAVVTDPPYGLSFMGNDWDDFEPREYQAWCSEWANLALDVLKPGGHLLAFSGDRTHHRLFSGIEDAGFEMRPMLAWIHGQGFPKGLDVSKAIDRAAGAERETAEVYAERSEDNESMWGSEASTLGKGARERTTSATKSAERWEGWKTQLKPAIEPIACARKTLDGTVAETVQTHGTGALNIGGCRIEYASRADLEEAEDKNPGRDERVTSDVYGEERPQQHVDASGRHPANVILDEESAEALDREVGELPGGARTPQTATGQNTSDAPTRNDPAARIQLESGGPSRYFYTSKATKAERTLDGKIENAHPTVKPLDLMEWLVRLVSAEEQIVLDPFAGTGTTCLAAKNQGRRFIGIEQDSTWADVARVRCGLEPEDYDHVLEDGETPITAYTDGGDP